MALSVLLVFSVLMLATPSEAQTPSEADCPSASQIQQFTETGDATTALFDVPTGQFVISYTFPSGATGIIYSLGISPENGEGNSVPVIGALPGAQNLQPNQGQVKTETTPGQYRLKFTPSDPNQEYVVTVYQCDPSGGEVTQGSAPTAPAPKASQDQKAKVDRNTIPKRRLAPTGGAPVASLVLAGVGIFGLGLLAAVALVRRR
jgi:hypothetical protein